MSKNFEKDADPITAELEFLADNTPTRFSLMKIRDTRTGLQIDVDQSLDSTFGGKSDDMKIFVEEMVKLHLYLEDNKYKGELNGLHKVQVGFLIIDFGEYEGETAYNWIKRYLKVVMNLLDREKVLDLKAAKEDYERRKRDQMEGLSSAIQ